MYTFIFDKLIKEKTTTEYMSIARHSSPNARIQVRNIIAAGYGSGGGGGGGDECSGT